MLVDKDRILKNDRSDDNEILHTKSEPVLESEFKELTEVSKKMVGAMLGAKGIGLAAPQMGLLKRILVIKQTDGNILFMANPEVVKLSEIKTQSVEGCLSVPNKTVKKLRSRQVTVKYIDSKGQEQEVRLSGLDAYCFQHELDHLNGKLMID